MKRHKVRKVQHYNNEMKNIEKTIVKQIILTGIGFCVTTVSPLITTNCKDTLPAMLLLLSSIGIGSGTLLLSLKEMIVDISKLINSNRHKSEFKRTNIIEPEERKNRKAFPWAFEEDINSDTRFDEKSTSETNFQDERPKVSLAKKPLIKGVSLKKK